MDYATLKLVHQTAVALSLAGFFVRGAGSLSGAGWVAGQAAKTLPHVVDTVLLVSAIALAWSIRLSPLQAPWLLAKIVALVVYVVLGSIALKPGRPLVVRTIAWIAALMTFGYIVSVALAKDPRGFLAALS
jgi:uncharacterized membrane protein SirB2